MPPFPFSEAAVVGVQNELLLADKVGGLSAAKHRGEATGHLVSSGQLRRNWILERAVGPSCLYSSRYLSGYPQLGFSMYAEQPLQR